MFTSCATILNRPGRFVRVYTTKPTVLIHNADTIKTQSNLAFIYAERQKKPLEFVVLTDTGAKKVIQKSTLSFAFILNFYNSGIGALIDLGTTKRYGYPNIRLNEKDTVERPRPYVTISKKGDFLLNISMPMYNWFYFRPDGEPVKNIKGGPGFSMGVDYFHSQKQFLNLSAAVAIDRIDISDIKPYGIFEKERTRYLSLSNNHVINKFTIGYGISYAYNAWEYINAPNYRDSTSIPLTGRPSQTISNNALGLVFSSYFKIVEGLNMGVIYRPTFIRFGSADKYEHLLSFDFGYKIPLKKKRFRHPARTFSGHPRPWPF